MFKKGVSPLIATVLLVMIVVSIGAAVMVVIQGLTDEQIKNIETQQDVLSCGTDVKVNLFKTASVYKVCFTSPSSLDGGNISLMMENAGQKDISGFKVTVLGDSGFDTRIFDNADLSKTQILGFAFYFNSSKTGSTIEKISVQPRIQGKETITCQYPPLDFDSEFLSSLQNCTSTTWDNSYTLSATTG